MARGPHFRLLHIGIWDCHSSCLVRALFLLSSFCLFQSITYQMKTLSHADQNRILGGPIALLKAHSSVVFEYCAREAAQIFGGLAYTRGGQGEKVERLYREVRAYAIPAGSEEIMLGQFYSSG